MAVNIDTTCTRQHEIKCAALKSCNAGVNQKNATAGLQAFNSHTDKC